MKRFCTSTALLAAALLPPIANPVGAVDMEALDRILSRTILDEDTVSTPTRDLIRSGIKPPVEMSNAKDWKRYAEYLREKLLKENVLRGEAAQWAAAECRVEWLDEIGTDGGYRIRKLRYEAIPGMWIPALLYQPDEIEGKIPVVMNVNGHDAKGNAADYKQIRCINQAKRGMAALSVEWFGMGQLRTPGFDHYKLNQIDLTGTSGIAPFYLSLKRGIDLLLSLEYADPERVAVAGLSGGGWQTIFIAALDERVTLANPVAGYSSFHTRLDHPSDLGDSEQTPSDFALLADYTHLTALVAPRPILLTYNDKDVCCFDSDHALAPLLDYAAPVYDLFEKGANLRHHINTDPGTHNFERDNREALYRMLGDHFFAEDGDYTAEEIDCAAEVRTAEELTVELPSPNADFHSVALELAAALPEADPPPSDPTLFPQWEKNRRRELGELLTGRLSPITDIRLLDKVRDGDLNAAILEVISIGGFRYPIIEIWKTGYPLGRKKVVLITNGARKNSTTEIARRLDAGQRVLVIEPYFTGETAFRVRPHLTSLLLSSIGVRLLGTQARTVAAVAHWQKARSVREVTLAGDGPLSSLIALTAPVMLPGCAERIEMTGAYGSLAEVIENDITVEREPAWFVFGLLARLDIGEIARLVAPAEIVLHDPTERAREGLGPVVPWYESRGGRIHFGAPETEIPEPLPPDSKITGFEEFELSDRSTIKSRSAPPGPVLPPGAVGPPAAPVRPNP